MIREKKEVEAFLQQFMPKQELYIKIAMGRPGSKTICISFHKAEHPITYAFK